MREPGTPRADAIALTLDRNCIAVPEDPTHLAPRADLRNGVGVLGTVHRSFIDSNAHDCVPPFLDVPNHRLRCGGPKGRCRVVVELRSLGDNSVRERARAATLLRHRGGSTRRMPK